MFLYTQHQLNLRAVAQKPLLILTMLDAFEILTTSGIVLWRKHYAPLSSNVINSLINDVFIEERQKPSSSHDGSVNAPYKKDKYTLRYTTVKDVGLIFVVGKRSRPAEDDVVIG